jgi:phosphoesterase RecJ-like protein
MAGCLYAAVLTDTGSFTFASTTAATFACAEHLLECGADANAIAQSIYFSNPPGKVRLLGIALTNMQIDGRGLLELDHARTRWSASAPRSRTAKAW